jgi:WD40 repeat protein
MRTAWMKNCDTAKNPYAEDELYFSLVSDEGGFTCLIQKPWPHPAGQKQGEYNMLSVSPNGSFLAAGDRLYSMLTGEQFSNFATVNKEYRSGFTRDGKYWGFTMGSPSSAVRTMRTLDKNATLYNIINTLDVAASPFKMLYHPDGRQMAVVFETVGVKFYDMPTYEPGLLFPFDGQINDAALSDDGTLLLIAGGNTVRLYDTRTARVLRSFYAQHANVRDTQAISVQFGEHDDQILIGWGYNYVEVFKRVKPVQLTMTPSERSLLPGQSQAYRFGMTLEDGTVWT